MYIYIHIPFCHSICAYCDFPKVLYDKKYIKKYLDSLKQEILSRYQMEQVVSIYIGGGTPTSLDLEELRYLLEITKMFKVSSHLEFTIESNIECLTKEKIKLLKEFGVNRVSLGVQSFQKEVLDELHRHHTKGEVFQIVNHLKQEGISNISIDYIYGISPNIEKVQKDLTCFLELDIPHISCYSLIIEDGTLFGVQKRRYIDEDMEEEMYRYIEKFLEEHGYFHYELSNYTKPGCESIHNLNYWNNGDYYGFGMGAVSFLNHYRITNTKSLTSYIDGNYLLLKEYEDRKMRISNTFMLGFRKIQGINIRDFYEKYQQNILEIRPVVRLLQEKKLRLEDGQLFIAPDYIYLSNEILMLFV